MHRVILKTPQGMETDHINQNKLDNRRSNLRACTKSQNMMNQGLTKANTSGYKGIIWDKNREKWMVRLMFNNKNIHLGRYLNIKDAILVRKNAEKLYFKEFANNL